MLADAVLVSHLGFVVFAVFGGLLALRWRWLPWLHLPALAWGAFVEFSGRVCPLTPLENLLRDAEGGVAYTGGFIDHYVRGVIYPSNWSDIHVWLGVLLLVGNVLLYSVVFRRRPAGPDARQPSDGGRSDAG